MNDETKSKRNNVTIFDVAKEAGVSYSTVSRVVNDFQFIKPETRERVQAAMDKLGYVANVKARSLAGGRSQMLGLLVYDFESSYLIEIVRGIDAAVSSLDYDLMLYTTHHRRRKESTLVAKLTQGLVDGLLIVLPKHLEAYLDDLDRRRFPYVLIDHAGAGTMSNTVKAMNWQGSFDAVAYLVSLGHRRIGFITGLMEVDSASERFAGYQAGLAHHGLLMEAALVAEGDFSWESGQQGIEYLLDLLEPPTAVIVSCDEAAFGAMNTVLSKGLRVPEDVSIIGFDDVPEAVTKRPSLTTMRQDLRLMGDIATRRLVASINDPTLPTEQLLMPMELIIRESTCSPTCSVFWQEEK